ncbi:unnamed protein product [Clonostachys rosea f. rosea IK726]|uniref:RING-type E3 ubiquitin transferase n=2 Tax=Bionectria ochroleuca TaxID=29856 RepID=A0A0B7JVJ7_BIOOC|nr:unnamed protein product [Clonostachys rosea f. rosea IK726]
MSSPPPRSSRLRRFSNLRNITHGHLLGGITSSGGGKGGYGANGTSTTGSTDNLAGSPSDPEGHFVALRSAPLPGHSNDLSLVNSAPAGSSSSQGLSIDLTNPLVVASAETSPSAIPRSNPMALTTPTFGRTNGASAPSTPTPGAASEGQPTTAAATQTADSAAAATTNSNTTGPDLLPSIRFSAYYDPRSTRPSLTFPPITRTLPTGKEVIRVGRYSERDSQSMANMPGNQPSAAAVGFKSKVVSRRHCEFWHENGKWYIKDVKSSSGTFLNHIRLSPPSLESKAFPVNDGDIVQLGIDFKGGEEMIFRCVKMRLELNRGWQNKLNTFNMAAHKRLRTMGTGSQGSNASGSSDCSICLNSIAPCQSLFVAPCSHTWHFKCVRSLLTSPQYPIFICPNCRAGADLEADVDDAEDWDQLDGNDADAEVEAIKEEAEPAAPAEVRNETPNDGPSPPQTAPPPPLAEDEASMDIDPAEMTMNMTVVESSENQPNLTHSTSEPVPIANPASGAGRASRDGKTPSPPPAGAEGPITPRNEAGPWVFDGSGQRNPEAGEAMGSLDAAADMLNGASINSPKR